MYVRDAIKMGLASLGYKITCKRKPLNLMLSVTDRCTSNCRYCSIPERKGQGMSVNQIFSIIDQAVELGCARIGLWGGEPLIRPDIGEIIHYARSKGLYVTLDTNGYLVPEKIDAVLELSHLIISIDGREKPNDLNREPGSFKKVRRAMDAVGNRIPVWTLTVVTKHNLGEIDYLLSLCEERGYKASFQLLHHNEYLSRNHSELLPSDEDYRFFIRELWRAKRKGRPVINSFNYLKYLYTWSDFSKPTLREKRFGLKCLAGKLYCNIDTDGRLYPCSLLIDKVPAPDVLSLGLKKAFERISPLPCESCIATCFIEYNYLFALNFKTIMGWIRNMSFE